MHRFFSIVLIFFLSVPTGVLGKDKSNASDSTHTFECRDVVLPLMMVTAASTGLYTNTVKNFNWDVRDAASTLSKGVPIKADDYVQYLPVVSYMGLDFVTGNARHSLLDRTIITTTSYLAMGIMVNTIKYTVRELRPDGSTRNSFPSGHSATAFMGAELVRIEYGGLYGAGAYAIACGIGFLRIYNNRHWATDVLAGAGIGILSARIGYWMLPLNKKLFKPCKSSKRSLVLMAAPAYEPLLGAYGAAVSLSF